MPLNQDKQLKFKDDSTTETLTIVRAGLEELQFGIKHVVHINEIKGFDHFLPSDGLIKKMKEENVDIGDKITITKAPKSDKYPYGYFSVDVVEKDPITNSPVGAGFAQKDVKHKSIENFEKQFEMTMEEKVNVLWDWYQMKASTEEENKLPS